MALPGGDPETRPLHFIWLLDRSNSMGGTSGKIQALNDALQQIEPILQDAVRSQAHTRLLVRALAFSDDAAWLEPDAVDVVDYRPPRLTAGGRTALGAALRELTAYLKTLELGERYYPPVLVLVSDGEPTDRPGEWEAALDELLQTELGAAATRLAIAIGRDVDQDVLARFIADAAVPICQADRPEELVAAITWASTVAKQRSQVPGETKLPPAPIKVVPSDESSW
jgi:uncharacterized protein YegL